MRISSGTLLYRKSNTIEVLIVHPSGAYNTKAPWSIPKGLPNPNEELEAAARRETNEETGVNAGQLTSLGYVDYKKSRKRVYCFAGESPPDANPKPVSWENDKVEFISLDRAKQLLHPSQAIFIDRLIQLLSESIDGIAFQLD